MTKQVGVWIDHRKAVIAILAGKIEQGAASHVEHGEARAVLRCGAGGLGRGPAGPALHRPLNKYYDQVVGCIRDADSILILGPGEAKVELEQRLGKEGLGERIVGVETVDKMTDRQVAARVRQRFLKSQRRLGKRVAV